MFDTPLWYLLTSRLGELSYRLQNKVAVNVVKLEYYVCKLIDVVTSLPNILFDIWNGILLIVNVNYIKVIMSLLNDVQFTVPSIISDISFLH